MDKFLLYDLGLRLRSRGGGGVEGRGAGGGEQQREGFTSGLKRYNALFMSSP